MSSRSRTPITLDNVPDIFSDHAVSKIATEAKLPQATDIPCLARGIRASAARYASIAREPTPNTIRREIDALVRAAQRRRCDEVARLLVDMSAAARQLLEGRGARIPSSVSPHDQRAASTFPRSEELRDAHRRIRACQRIYDVAVVGGHARQGRKRPSGKRSYRWQVQLHAPEPTRAEPRRSAERQFLVFLRRDYVSATGSMPPRTAHHDTPGPFARMVAACLRLARVPTAGPNDDLIGLAVQLINDMERARKLRELSDNWQRIIGPIRCHEAVAGVVRLIEQGKAAVLHVPTGDDAHGVVAQPALIEFEETGTLCFYLSPSQWRTIAARPKPRARIMQLADNVRKAARR